MAWNDYDAVALEYARHADVSLFNAYYERPALHALLPDVAGKRVLDAGCAAGAHTEWLLQHGASVVALDGSKSMVKLAQRRLGDRADVIHADLALPLPEVPALANASFNLVLSSLTLHYLADWQQPLSEFRRVLKSGSRLLFSTHHPYWDRRLLSPDDYFATGLVEDHWSLSGGPPRPFHFFRKTLGEILTAVAQADFVIEQVVEPQPSQALRERSPGDYESLRKQPAFLIVQARKS
jgi:SAM-dependent methyltransferase